MEEANKELSVLHIMSNNNNNNNNNNENIINDDNDEINNIILKILAVGLIFHYFHTIDIIKLLTSTKVLLKFKGM